MNLLLAYALQFVGTPYIWNGSHPALGLDCNHLVKILLLSQGVDVRSLGNAQSLFDHFSDPANHMGNKPELGALIFYGSGTKGIYHVAMALSDNSHIEAGGGSHRVLTLRDSIGHQAFTRVTEIRKKDQIGIFNPHYPFRPLP